MEAKIEKKDATVTATDGAGPGEFHVILSAQTRDRDGEVLTTDTWKTPLPEHITFDTDHGMDVRSTVGSGTPFINPATGNLEVKGTFSSLPRAQEVRTLINEGHIKTTSVAFMREKTVKDGTSTETRELLNGAFVSVPSNREAIVLAAKAALKAGARNSRSDAETIQTIHDQACALGAACDTGKSFTAPDADIKSAPEPLDGSAPVQVPDEDTDPAAAVDAAAAEAAADTAAAVEVTDSDVDEKALQILLAAFQ